MSYSVQRASPYVELECSKCEENIEKKTLYIDHNEKGTNYHLDCWQTFTILKSHEFGNFDGLDEAGKKEFTAQVHKWNEKFNLIQNKDLVRKQTIKKAKLIEMAERQDNSHIALIKKPPQFSFAIPSRIVERVFFYLPFVEDVVECSSVCKLWNAAAKSEEVWKGFCMKVFQISTGGINKSDYNDSWRQTYQAYHLQNRAKHETDWIDQNQFDKLGLDEDDVIRFGIVSEMEKTEVPDGAITNCYLRADVDRARTILGYEAKKEKKVQNSVNSTPAKKRPRESFPPQVQPIQQPVVQKPVPKPAPKPVKPVQKPVQKQPVYEEEEEDFEDSEDDKPLYCYCNRPEAGEMVGCDDEDCEIEWFHFSCAGLTKPPKGKWFCRNCKRNK